jgi:hypothetical protein
MQKTLLLCYPDEMERSGESLAAECLECLQGDTVVHCGELFGDTASLDHAPWGRTTAHNAQTILFSHFRCAVACLQRVYRGHGGARRALTQHCVMSADGNAARGVM